MDIKMFECPVCYEVADGAVETTCCHQLFCEKCIRPLTSSCPLCRRTCDYQPNYAIRRIIDTLEVPCEFCNETFVRANMTLHRKTCPCRDDLECRAQGCKFTGQKDVVVNHFITEHIDLMINDPVFPAKKAPIGDPRLLRIKQRDGTTIRLGSSGKHYCGGRLMPGHPRCCDGSCGPSNGCNCSACMQLDIDIRKLPVGYYVNREGAIATKSDKTGLIYCGRHTMPHNRHCDGYCGPSDGPQCRACEILQQIKDTEYRLIKWDK